MRTQRTGSARGFTILELLIIMMVITLVACLAITAFFRQPHITLDNATALLMEDMLMAKNRALILRSEVKVSFYAEGNGYEVRDANGDLLQNPAAKGDFIRDYTYDGVFEDVKILEVDFGPDRSLSIDRHGQAKEDGRVTIGFHDATRIVEVSREGGVRLVGEP